MQRAIRERYLAVLPAGSALILSSLYSSELPVDDYWDVLAGCYAYRGADLKTRLAFYWDPFNEHNLLFPKMSIDLLSWLTNNRHYALEIILGFISRLITFFLVWRMIAKSHLSERSKTFAVLGGAFLIFWPIQLPVFTMHIASTVFAWSLLFAVLAVYLLHKFWGRWLGTITAMLACVISSYSFGAGISMWPAIGLCLLAQKEWSAKQKAAWWLFSLIFVGLHYISLPSRAEFNFPPLLTSLRAPVKFLSFFFKCFTPPFNIFWELSDARVPPQTLVGIIMTAVYIIPMVLLFRQSKLFTRAHFPWLTLIVWSIGFSVSAALSRSSFEVLPRHTYFVSQVLALVACIPLWLSLYPNLGRPQGTSWISLPGLLRLLVGVGLMGIYAVGTKEGVVSTQDSYHQVRWGQSCLQYYPALDNHPLYLFPFDKEGLFTTQTLPLLVEHHALSDHINPTPFTIPVPTTFKLEDLRDLQVRENGPQIFQFIVTGNEPLVVLKPSPVINKRHVVSFTLESSFEADIKFAWDDGGTEQKEEKSLSIGRRGALVTRNHGYFPESLPDGRDQPVEAVWLEFINIKGSDTVITIRNLQVLTR